MENTPLKTHRGNELGKRRFPNKLEMVFESRQSRPTLLNFRPDCFTSQEIADFRKGQQNVKTDLGTYKKMKDMWDMVYFDKGSYMVGKILFYKLKGN